MDRRLPNDRPEERGHRAAISENFAVHGRGVAYSESGFDRLPRLLSERSISAFRSALGELLSGLGPGSRHWDAVVPLSVLGSDRNPGVRSPAAEHVPFIIGSLPALSADFLELILEEALWAAAKDILEADEVVYQFSNITRKPAFVGPNLSWHRDYPNQYMCPEKADDFFRALIPLEGMDRRNGCTEVLPGTHLVSDAFARYACRDKMAAFDVANAIPLEADPGDMIAIHPKVVHGGRENRSAMDRNLVVIQFGRRTDRFLWKCEERHSGLSRDEIWRSVR